MLSMKNICLEGIVVWNDARFHVDRRTAAPAGGEGLTAPMYTDAAEIIALIKLAVEEQTGYRSESVRSLESGMVEEFAVVTWIGDREQLLFRMWPVFFSHPKRVEYRLYIQAPDLKEIIRRYVDIFAHATGAELVIKA